VAIKIILSIASRLICNHCQKIITKNLSQDFCGKIKFVTTPYNAFKLFKQNRDENKIEFIEQFGSKNID
jgi:hypothetical protein